MAVTWVKIDAILEALGKRHPDFCAAFDNVKCAFVPADRQYVRDGYVDPPV